MEPTFWIYVDDGVDIYRIPSYALDWVEAGEEALDLEDEGIDVVKISSAGD